VTRRRPTWPLTGTRNALRTAPALNADSPVIRRHLALARAQAVMSTVPSRYIPTKAILDEYLDTIGVGR